MKLDFTTRMPGNTRLILLFSGWSTSVALYSGIEKPGWDTAVVTDYSDLQFPTEVLSDYSTIYLYCWSLGVWAASRVIPADKITMAFAVNGTENPVDDRYGIPEKIFHGTAAGLDERTLYKFRRRMLGKSQETDIAALSADSLPPVELKHELEYIAGMAQIPADNSPICWRRVYIGDQDMIFPPQNQHRAWRHISERCREIYVCEGEPHYISLKRIVDTTIPDTCKVGQRFEDSSDSYDSNALAQLRIAEKLTGMLRTSDVAPHSSVLEIGQGTGLFTKLYAKVINPASIEFVDIYQTPALNVADKEIYHVEDAEIWMEKHKATFDLLVSASTIQWFRNPIRFFENGSRLLNKDGILVCSTFLPGTLEIFDRFRPSPMLYIRKDELIEAAGRWFGNVETEELKIELTFSDAKKALLHLNHTGVGGSFGRFASLREVVKSISTQNGDVSLTFNALCIKAYNRK